MASIHFSVQSVPLLHRPCAGLQKSSLSLTFGKSSPTHLNFRFKNAGRLQVGPRLHPVLASNNNPSEGSDETKYADAAQDEMSFNFDKVNALLKSKAKGKGVKRKASDKNFISDPPVDNPTDRVTPTPTLTHPPTPIRSLSNPQPGGQETSSRSKVRVDEDVDAISDALDHVLLDDMKKKSGTAIHRAFSVEMRRVLTMERALLDSLEVTSKSYAEVVNANSQLERELIETKKLLAQKDKSLGEKDLLMSSMREEYERKLESCGREAVEAYKVSSDFDEVAGMYGVKSMIHAYRKVKEWLQQDHPEIDLSEFESFADAEALDDELEQGGDASQRSPPAA